MVEEKEDDWEKEKEREREICMSRWVLHRGGPYNPFSMCETDGCSSDQSTGLYLRNTQLLCHGTRKLITNLHVACCNKFTQRLF